MYNYNSFVLLKTEVNFHLDYEKCNLSPQWVILGSPWTLPAPTPLLVPLISLYSSSMVIENSRMSQGIWALMNAPIREHLTSCTFPTCSWAAAHAITTVSGRVPGPQLLQSVLSPPDLLPLHLSGPFSNASGAPRGAVAGAFC